MRLASVPAGHEVGEATFSLDGRHVGFVATKDGSAFVYADATRHGPYQAARGLSFPAAGGGLAFLARRDEKEFVVVDGKEGPAFGAVGTFVRAPDGTVVYSAQRAGKWVIVADGNELEVAGDSDPSPAVSADGRWVVFVEPVLATGKVHLRTCSLKLEGCLRGDAHDAIVTHRTDRTGGQLVVTLSKGGKQAVARVEIDGTKLLERDAGWFDETRLFAVPDGGGHLAVLGYSDGQQLLLVDGRQLQVPELDSPLEMVASPAGRVLVTAVMGDKVMAFLDGKQLDGEQSGIDFPVLSADGARYAYAANRRKKYLVVVDGHEGPLFDMVVTPRFSPDGARIVYRARQDGERFVVVADVQGKTLREHPHYEAVFDVVISPDGSSIGYGVRSGADLWWKVEKL